MDILWVVIGFGLAILVLLIIILFMLSRGSGGEVGRLNETFDRRMGQNIEELRKISTNQLDRLKEMESNITKEVSEVKFTGKQMLGFTEQLKEVERILKSPQQRGALGEVLLDQIIHNVLPAGSYEFQHTFSNGLRADAVIKLDDKLIAIDAKFSLGAYSEYVETTDQEKQDKLEKHIKALLKDRIKETSKYILPNENTLDFAFMFIPSETVYYDLISNRIGSGEENMIEYAYNQHKVIIVSPTTLLAYLQTVQLGLKSLKIEQEAKNILKHLQQLQKHHSSYIDVFHRLGKTIGTTVSHYNNAQSQYNLIHKDMEKLTGKESKFKKEEIAERTIIEP